MFKRMVIAGVALVAATASSFAAEWMVLKAEGGNCFVVDRKAEAGEAQVGGPYGTEEEATAAIKSLGACQSDPNADNQN